MNVERLRELVQKLLQHEQELTIQTHLAHLNSSLTSFVGSPSNAQQQVEVANRLTALSQQVDEFLRRHNPAELRSLAVIGALQFFGQQMIDDIRGVIRENPLTPAVVQQHVEGLLNRRQQFIKTLDSVFKNLGSLGVESAPLQEGEAEVGFQIPRDLFANELDGLITELRTIKRIIKALSELATSSAEPIIVREISSTDPLFVFALEPATIALIAGCATWALNTWKQIEEIRKIRREASQTPAFSQEEIKNIFDAKIQQMINHAIEQKTNELIGTPDGKAGRKEEQRTYVAWVLESILARVERGMTVEIRFLPPPGAEAPQEGDDKLADEDSRGDFQTLQELAPQLAFPVPDESPILALPKMEEDRASGRSNRPKKDG